ncbi:hydrogenase nickel incorporation protein HypB [Cocleimonas flava]|uniref:Hydrogenase maturation factor HypB n=1 Tax=Cocleimonas flava TaxID=634765 RepID=A0A4R1F725_9GAMM|nr:hydrogenase nickel incorporation protein HypB [Cocleimonas flava]TCJ88394.1 hydrogenase nickel incorporation protein HypB [Cocleimonas flava]
MCTVCGCGSDEVKVEGHSHNHSHDHDHSHNNHSHEHSHANGHTHSHEHHNHEHNQDTHYGLGPAHAHVPGLSQSRMIEIEQNILGKNHEYANENRRFFTEQGVLSLNLVSSPGSGKTTLLTQTITDLKDDLSLSVIEGDQQTANDAERIRATGVPALQINTGKGCHLDAHMVGHAMEKMTPEEGGVLFIENVGNLVCPAAFDLGEAHKVAILSVTEGEDKPLKYPDMFNAADIMLLNKIDLLPYLQFDVDKCIEYARRVNPSIQVLQVSATSGEGMENWYHWIKSTRQMKLIGHPSFNTTTATENHL